MAPKRPHEGGNEASGWAKKKQKTTAARTIRFQTGSSSGTGVVTNSMAGLPGSIDVEKFTEARSFEITAMQSAIQTAKGSSTQRAWQTLPRSLRRRSASHDVRRVPVRLREKAQAEMDPAKRKALGRNFPKRGRSKQITRTQSFLKRQRDKTWLETHLWHAKRMHMKNIWGYRLSETPTEKAYRPSHRSAVHSSILHDASYICTISISGKQSILEKLLVLCCDCQGAGPGAVRYVLGSRIHETHLYRPGTFPFSLIAPITLIWRPLPASSPSISEAASTSVNDTTQSSPRKRRRRKGKEKEKETVAQVASKPDPDTRRTLWIRVHPSAWQEVWDTVKEVAGLTLDKIRKEEGLNNNEKLGGKRKQPKQSPLEHEDSIELVDLRPQINCFELMGPRSSQVLVSALKVVDGDDRPIFKQYGVEFWNQLKDLQTPGSVPRGMISSMKVHDPRLNFPPKNIKPATKTESGLPSTSLPAAFTVYPNAALARGEIWDEIERDGGSLRPRFKKKDLDERRRDKLVPGTALKPLRQDDRVPIMLIQRTAGPLPSSSLSHNHNTNDLENMHGWTILLPTHWSMPFFSSLTHTGTRVGGLRERRTQVFEAGSPDYPFDYPLTPAYAREEEMSERVERERWERKPPAKRIEWESVGTRSPWRADWEVVLGFRARTVEAGLLAAQRDQVSPGTADDASSDSTQPWLLRGPDTPGIIEAVSASQHPAATLLEKINVLRAKRALDPLGLEGTDLLKGALVPVKLHILGRGAPDDLAAIYEVGLEEGTRLRQMLVRKKSGDIKGEADAELSTIMAGDSAIIGYVTTGKYSLSRGKGYAIGAVSLARLLAIIAADNFHDTSHCKLVKVKDREGPVCRAGSLEILTT